MRNILLPICLAAAASSAFADAVKYRQPNGQVLITNQAAPDGSKAATVQREEYISPEQQQNATNDLERQKNFLRARERENHITVVRANNANTSPSKDTEQLHACLRKVTGTFGLSPSQEAGQKVDCYSGTVGLNDDCQRSVAATMRLSTQAETFYKGNCPR